MTNSFRRNTAVIEAVLPFSPAEKTLYYTVWKDGQNMTSDPRLGTAACGQDTGFVGDVPASGAYVGRLCHGSKLLTAFVASVATRLTPEGPTSLTPTAVAPSIFAINRHQMPTATSRITASKSCSGRMTSDISS
ncbi:MAG: hypothetical protein M2R45_04994 [Verrucomicrobia subdivision 3 bacterium]|nr:hypothetical protein [Limisphaerales bacterium]MCS1415591.1 hypothetical protein [Limisphaerales bacterium]